MIRDKDKGRNKGQNDIEWHQSIRCKPVSRRRREQKDVLSKMQKILGPLGMLHGCMENKIRVRRFYTD
ncbi:hypothetical protein G5I_08719 [Acromyrmex echinatior]|uniref:Uncharacterized protein n=1 Tax=Acromyrmex echinatior TaxID=103372 RepID=F4WSA3_ACREC|nr:hypothetical protein G5I_08719 [Acromyrmex echinatior]